MHMPFRHPAREAASASAIFSCNMYKLMVVFDAGKVLAVFPRISLMDQMTVASSSLQCRQSSDQAHATPALAHPQARPLEHAKCYMWSSRQ